MQNFADRVSALRKSLGFPTDPQLAKAMGISARTLYYAVQDGKVSSKTLWHLEQAEIAAGIRPRGDFQRLEIGLKNLPTSGKPGGSVFQGLEEAPPRFPGAGKALARRLQRLEKLAGELAREIAEIRAELGMKEGG